MASCPICQKQVEIKSQHHGALYNCPHCYGSYFIDWDGNPEPPPPQEALPADFGMTPPVAETPAEGVVEDQFAEPAAAYETLTPNAEEAGADAFAAVEASSADQFESFAPPAESASEVDSFAAPIESPVQETSDWGQPVASEAVTSPEESALLDFGSEQSSGLQDIADFGNSSASSGPLSYTLVVDGIELAETYGEIRDAITDSRFAWDADKIMKSIKSGRLELRGLNATKAALLVNRLKYLPVEISWSQEIYAASEELDSQ